MDVLTKTASLSPEAWSLVARHAAETGLSEADAMDELIRRGWAYTPRSQPVNTYPGMLVYRWDGSDASGGGGGGGVAPYNQLPSSPTGKA